MLFAVRFEDDPAKLETRKQYLKAHIDWLAQHAEHILVGGSLRVAPDADPIGGLWIIEAESKKAVQQLIETDPFWQQHLRCRVEILYWSKAFADRQVPV